MKKLIGYLLSICFSVIFTFSASAKNEDLNFLKTAENLLLNAKSGLEFNNEIMKQ